MTNLNLQNLSLQPLQNFSKQYLKTLSNEELARNLQGLVQKERQTLSEILLHVQEVHRRKLYLKMSYGSLFDYLTKHLKYSAGSAQRRIDACRLSQEVPDLIENLESGELTLAQVSLVQKSFREKEKALRKPSATKLSRSEQSLRKVEIVNNLKQKSIAESQVIVAKSLELEIKAETKLRHQADESVRLEITLTKQQWQKLNKMRDLISHSLPHGSWDQVLEYVSDRVIASKTQTRKEKTAATQTLDPKLTATNASKSPSGCASASTSASANAMISASAGPSPVLKPSLYKLRKQVLQRDQCCQYRDQQTQKLCFSTWQLQVDHIKPRWAGGTDELSNLRVLCGQHNRQVYRWQCGIGT